MIKKAFLITFETPEAVEIFIEHILAIPDGKGLTLHVGEKIDEFAEEYRNVPSKTIQGPTKLPPILLKMLKSA